MRSFITTDGYEIIRLSRWIKIKYDYNITPRHSLFYYADDCGDNTKSVDYFIYNKKKYAIGQFINMSSAFGCAPVMWYENGKLQHLAGYDADGSIYNPLMIEVDDGGEYVRVYENGRTKEEIERYKKWGLE